MGINPEKRVYKSAAFLLLSLLLLHIYIHKHLGHFQYLHHLDKSTNFGTSKLTLLEFSNAYEPESLVTRSKVRKKNRGRGKMSRMPSPPPYGDSYELQSSPPPYQATGRVFDSNRWLQQWSVLAGGRDISEGLIVNGRHTSESNIYLAALCEIYDASADWWAVLEREVARGMVGGGGDWIAVTGLRTAYLMYGRRPMRQAWNLRGSRRIDGEMVKRVTVCLREVLEDLGEEGRLRVDTLQGGRIAGDRYMERLISDEDELPAYGDVGTINGSRGARSSGGESSSSGQYHIERQGWLGRVWDAWMHMDDDVPVHLRGTRYGRLMKD
jgi:hypothetical protein